MNSLDLYLFGVLNAHAASPAWLIDAAAWYSENFATIAISSMLLALALGSGRVRRAMVLCLVAMLVAWCITRLVRWGFPLERPYEMGLGTKWIDHGTRPRFPSLHAAVAFAFAAGLSRWCAWGRAALCVPVAVWTMALLMGWSRVYMGVHLPMDILAGLVVGMVSVRLVATLRTPAYRLIPPGKFATYWFHPGNPSAPHK